MDLNGCRGGKFEIWYVKFTDLSSGRHVLFDLMKFKDGDICRIVFEDGQGGGCVCEDRFAAGTLRASRESFEVRLGDNRLDREGARGEAGNGPRIECDLSFEWGSLGFDFNPAIMYKLPLSDMMMASPALDLRVSGTVTVDGVKHHFRDAPGTQTHYWGRRLYPNWIYLSCNTFEESGRVFEVSAPRLPVLGLRGTAVVRYQGRVYRMNKLRSVLRDVRILADGSQGVWVVEARSGSRRFVFTVTASPGSMLVTHEAGKRKVLYTGHADCYVSVYRRFGPLWRKAEDLSSKSRCAAEIRI